MTALADDAVPPPAPAAPAPKAAALSIEEMQARSADLVAGNEASYRDLLHQKEIAKKEKDLIKLSCVNDKLVQIKAKIGIAEETNTELQGALSSAQDSRFEIFTRLTQQSADVTQTRDEGRACIGASELYKQEAGLDVQKPDLPDDPGVIDPYNPDGQGPGELDPPGYASPFN